MASSSFPSESCTCSGRLGESSTTPSVGDLGIVSSSLGGLASPVSILSNSSSLFVSAGCVCGSRLDFEVCRRSLENVVLIKSKFSDCFSCLWAISVFISFILSNLALANSPISFSVCCSSSLNSRIARFIAVKSERLFSMMTSFDRIFFSWFLNSASFSCSSKKSLNLFRMVSNSLQNSLCSDSATSTIRCANSNNSLLRLRSEFEVCFNLAFTTDRSSSKVAQLSWTAVVLAISNKFLSSEFRFEYCANSSSNSSLSIRFLSANAHVIFTKHSESLLLAYWWTISKGVLFAPLPIKIPGYFFW